MQWKTELEFMLSEECGSVGSGVTFNVGNVVRNLRIYMWKEYCESEIEFCVHEGWGTHTYMHICEDQRPALASFLRSCLLYLSFSP